jgi:hypothetical protein
MKFIAHLTGTSAFRASPDDYVPSKGIIWNDVIRGIATKYKFANVPAIQRSTSQQVPLTFQAGEFGAEDEKIAIQYLFLASNGAAVQTSTSEQSDIVLEDLIAYLDNSFGFRIKASTKKRDYASTLIVQFEKSLESYIGPLETINRLVRDAVSAPPEVPFSLKRLFFGKEFVEQAPVPMQVLDAIDRMDFVIERRTNHPFKENRYYAAAPISSERLLRTLEDIEKVITQRP